MRRRVFGTIGIGTVFALVALSASGAPAQAATPTQAATSAPTAVAGAQAGTGTLTVMLMTPQKTRIERTDVEITLGTYDDQEHWIAETDAGGEATFSDVPAAADYVVHSYDTFPDGWSTRIAGARWQVAVQPGVHSWVVSVSREGAVVHGSVLAADGAAVNLAKVAIHDDWNDREYDTWTNADGRYQMIALPTTQVTVTVTKTGYSPQVSSFVVHAEYGTNARTVDEHDVTLQPTA
jgi:hypothetical protein